MVGLKIVGIIGALFLLGACVPQTKQTACQSNEAFNASLRTCVPVVNGPSSFININSFVPAFTVTAYKNSGVPITLSITISNPYAQTYTVEWERVFNGLPVSVTPTTPTSFTFIPSTLSTQVGTHIITAKVKDAFGVITDTHNFDVKINDLPLPIIDSASVAPITYNVTLNPTSAAQIFSFNIKNNGATIPAGFYNTTWSVTKNGAAVAPPSLGLPDVDNFTVFTTTGTNAAAFTFNPAAVGGGLGSYIVRGRLTNTSGDILGEQVWDVVVKHPNLASVTSRNLYAATALPAFTTIVTAYNGIGYTSTPSLNFVPVGQVAQADFCVKVADPEGTYAGDGNFVKVDFYLDGVTLIYTGFTSLVAGDDKVCLSEPGAAGILPSVLFTNTTTTAPQAHTMVARVTDVATNQEYTTADLGATLGTYPIAWNLTVNPINAPPTVSFTSTGNLSNIACAAGTSISKTCTVTQDLPFTLGVLATDDFYSTSSTVDAVQAKLSYTMNLNRNGSVISSCSKTFAQVADTSAPPADFVGPDYLCQLTVPSFDATGSVNPALFTYSVTITVTDLDSPVASSTLQTSNTITYNLNVNEASTTPVITPQGITNVTDSYFSDAVSPTTVIQPSGNPAHFITEGSTLNTNVLMADAEMDDYQVSVFFCTDFSVLCTTTQLLATRTVLKTDNLPTTYTSVPYPIPEDQIPTSSAIGANVASFFKVTAADIPDSLAGQAAISRIFSINIRNKNPAPQFTGTPSPALAAVLNTVVGFQLTLDPGTVADASTVLSESTISYQWYVDPTGVGGAAVYNAITGGTQRVLKWVPSNNTAASVKLRLCISDNTVANPQPAAGAVGTTALNSANGANCQGDWTVNVKKNAGQLLGTGRVASTIGSDFAVWHDKTTALKNVIYVAYTDAAGDIYVEKVVFDVSGNIYRATGPGFTTVKFTALQSGGSAAGTVKDLSLAGNATHLYIAYQAADVGTPGSPKMRVRRIDKSSGAAGDKTDVATFPHVGKFGYSYAGATLAKVDVGSVISLTNTPGAPYVVSFSGVLTVGDSVTVNGVTFSAADPETATTLCAGSGCSGTGEATKLASLINGSTSVLLQGLSASVSGSNVTITGATGNEYLDVHATLSAYIVGKLGSIMLDSVGNWYLPFVDLTNGATLNQVRVIKGTTATPLDAASGVTDTIVFSTIGQVSFFMNSMNPTTDQITVGAIDTAGHASLNLFSTAGAVIQPQRTLFGGNPIAANTLRIAAPSTGNTNYFAAAKVLTALPATFEWEIGRYDSSFAISVEGTMTSLSLNAATTNLVDTSDIVDVSLQSDTSIGPATSEARVLVSSLNGGVTSSLYTMRLKSTNLLSCDLCVPQNITTQAVSTTARVMSTPLLITQTLGSAGATAAENVQDIFFAAYSVDNNADGVFDAHFSLMSSEVQNTHSTSTDTNGNLGHRPSFFGLN